MDSMPEGHREFRVLKCGWRPNFAIVYYIVYYDLVDHISPSFLTGNQTAQVN